MPAHFFENFERISFVAYPNKMHSRISVNSPAEEALRARVASERGHRLEKKSTADVLWKPRRP